MSNHDLDPETAKILLEAAQAAARHLGLGEPEYMTICGRGEEIAMSEEQKANPRDTQFKGFAQSLAAEIADTDGWMLSDVEKLIARRAHDLVQHTVGYSLEYLHECGVELSGSMGKRILPSIPDLKEWPEREASK